VSNPRSSRRTAIVVAAGAGIAILALALSARRSDPTSTAPSSSTALIPSTVDAGVDANLGYRREPNACAVVFDEGEARIDANGIALALLEGFDPATGRVSFAPGREPSRVRITDCRGGRIEVASAASYGEPGLVNVTTNAVGGPPELVDDAGVGATVVARVALGDDTSGCFAQRGILALVTLRGRRLEVDALASTWTGSCGPSEPLTLTRFGDGTTALFEEEASSEDSATWQRSQRVWLRRPRTGGDVLVLAGSIPIELEDVHEPWPVEGARRAMTATLRPSRKGVTANEAWTTEPLDLGFEDAGRTTTKIIVREYRLDGDRLAHSP
jgi:hypothetical protein